MRHERALGGRPPVSVTEWRLGRRRGNADSRIPGRAADGLGAGCGLNARLGRVRHGVCGGVRVRACAAGAGAGPMGRGGAGRGACACVTSGHGEVAP